MDIVPFDPSKPFSVVSGEAGAAPAQQQTQQVPFDPSKPFTVVKSDSAALPPDKQMGMVRGGAHETLKGVPVLGPLGAKALDAGNAYFSGDPNKSFHENYETAGKTREAEEKDYEERHPYISTGAQLAGGFGSLLAGGSTLLGAKMLGMVGGIPQMAAVGALSGAALGGADAYLRGEDPKTNAALGAGAGVAGPVLGRAVSKIAAPFVNEVRAAVNPAGEANRVVAGGLIEDQALTPWSKGITQHEYENMPQTRAMDLGAENTQAIARSAANLSPTGRDILNRSVDEARTGRAQRTEDFINHNFNFPDAAAQQKALDQANKIANANGYPAAYKIGDAKFPNGFNGVDKDLDQLLALPDVQAAMAKAAKSMPGINMSAGSPATLNMQQMDLTYRLLRDKGNKMFRSGQGTLGTSFSNQATALRAQLDKMVPEYGATRNMASEYFNASDALEAGKNLASTAKPDIDAATAAYNAFNAKEKQLFHDGYLSQVIQNARNSGDRGSYLSKITDSDPKRKAMDLALGTTDSAKVQTFLRVENIMDASRHAIQGNSTTARQMLEYGLAGGVGSSIEGTSPLTDPVGFMHGALLYGGLRYGHGILKERVARQVAELLVSRDMNRVRAGLDIASRNENVFQAIKNADAALGSVGTHAGVSTAQNVAGVGGQLATGTPLTETTH
jgi:hypothetical protein